MAAEDRRSRQNVEPCIRRFNRYSERPDFLGQELSAELTKRSEQGIDTYPGSLGEVVLGEFSI